jgi:hypothetical protein
MNDARLNEIDNKIAEKIIELAPALANAAFRVAMAGIGYAVTTVAGKVVTMLTGSLSSVTGTLGSVAAGALSGLSGLVTAVGTNVVTPIFSLIKPFIGKVVIDEAFKAHTKTNKTVTENVPTVDAEVEKAKKSTFRKFANFCEEICPGSGDFVFLVLYSIPGAIFTKLFNMCCNCEKGKKEARTKIDPPAEAAVTPTKRTRARNKSPAPNAKTQ